MDNGKKKGHEDPQPDHGKDDKGHNPPRHIPDKPSACHGLAPIGPNFSD